MLELTIHDGDREVVLEFEHSLLSLSKWESKYQKPFLTKDGNTAAEMIDYYQCMLVTPGVDANLVFAMDPDQHNEIIKYISDPRTASSVPKSRDVSQSGERITSELIYYWMVALKIPFAAETWNLNRLMMLIQIANVKQTPPKKRSEKATMADWRALNEQRLAKYNTTG